jgi:hypothetical protein
VTTPGHGGEEVDALGHDMRVHVGVDVLEVQVVAAIPVVLVERDRVDPGVGAVPGVDAQPEPSARYGAQHGVDLVAVLDERARVGVQHRPQSRLPGDGRPRAQAHDLLVEPASAQPAGRRRDARHCRPLRHEVVDQQEVRAARGRDEAASPARDRKHTVTLCRVMHVLEDEAPGHAQTAGLQLRVTVVGSSGEFAAAYHFAGEFFEGDVDAQKHLTDQKIRRGTHTSVQALEVDIRD